MTWLHANLWAQSLNRRQEHVLFQAAADVFPIVAQYATHIIIPSFSLRSLMLRLCGDSGMRKKREESHEHRWTGLPIRFIQELIRLMCYLVHGTVGVLPTDWRQENPINGETKTSLFKGFEITVTLKTAIKEQTTRASITTQGQNLCTVLTRA